MKHFLIMKVEIIVIRLVFCVFLCQPSDTLIHLIVLLHATFRNKTQTIWNLIDWQVKRLTFSFDEAKDVSPSGENKSFGKDLIRNIVIN